MRRTVRTHAGWALVALLAVSTVWAQERHPASSKVQHIEELLEAWDVTGARAELEKLKGLMPHGAEPLQYFEGRVAFVRAPEDGRRDGLSAARARVTIASRARKNRPATEALGEHRALGREALRARPERGDAEATS